MYADPSYREDEHENVSFWMLTMIEAHIRKVGKSRASAAYVELFQQEGCPPRLQRDLFREFNEWYAGDPKAGISTCLSQGAKAADEVWISIHFAVSKLLEQLAGKGGEGLVEAKKISQEVLAGNAARLVDRFFKDMSVNYGSLAGKILGRHRKILGEVFDADFVKRLKESALPYTTRVDCLLYLGGWGNRSAVIHAYAVELKAEIHESDPGNSTGAKWKIEQLVKTHSDGQ